MTRKRPMKLRPSCGRRSVRCGRGRCFGGESKILHIDHLFLLVVCVLGSVKMPKYRKKGAGIPRIENVVLYKNRIGDSGAEAFAEGKKKCL